MVGRTRGERQFRRSGIFRTLLLLCWVPNTFATTGLTPAGSIPEVQLELPSSGLIRRGEVIQLGMAEPLGPSEELSVFIGNLDVTALAEVQGRTIRLHEAVFSQLRPGESEIVVYHRAEGEAWQAIGRLPVRILGRFGFREVQWRPRASVGLKAQVAESHFPETNRPPRERYADWEGRFGLESLHDKGGWQLRSGTHLFATSNQQLALRFAELRNDAPLLDLADYRLDFTIGRLRFSAGHLTAGSNRHLLSFFASRGLQIAAQLGERVRLTLSALNGSSIVGWGNFFGLDNRNHQIVAGEASFDLIRDRGKLSLLFTLLDGSVLPRAGFNQGVINDAEESRGWGVQAVFDDSTNRLHLEAGIARSRFQNPEDSLLAQGETLVPVEATTDTARFGQGTLTLLRDLEITEKLRFNLQLSYQHERIDPQYRSVGAFVQANQRTDTAGLTAALGELTWSLTYTRLEDNLDDLPSVLKTRTQRRTISAGAPLGFWFGGTSGGWPQLTYTFDETHQYGVALPVNGDFAESHVPDQLSRIHGAGLQWQWSFLSLNYNLNRSAQDNRQLGRSSADFKTLVHNVGVGLQPAQRLSLNLDWGWERFENLEFLSLDRTRRWGVNMLWYPTERSTLTAYLAHTTFQGGGPRENRNLQFDAQWSMQQSLTEGSALELFARYSHTWGDTLDEIFGLNERLESRTLQVGFNLSFRRE